MSDTHSKQCRLPVRKWGVLLFDHLVGTAKQRERKGKTERLGGLEVDDQLDFRGLLDWQVCGFLTLEYPADVDTDQAISIRKTSSVAHQAASHGKLAIAIVSGHRMANRQC